MVHIGIDIGTSNTVVAIAGADGEPQVRRIKDDPLVPSVIAVAEQGGHVLVGRDAVDEWANPDQDPNGIFRRWKILMGEEKAFRAMRFGGAASSPVDITPEWLTARLVEYVLAEVSAGIGGEVIDSVLITVPHGWRRDTPEKCQATRKAAALAQVNGKPISVQGKTVSEPVAAAVYWLWEARRAKEAGSADDFAGQHILVCDVGGGTFDLSLVRVGVQGEPLTVVDAINHYYAGDYATALIVARATKQFNDECGTDLTVDADQILGQLGDAPTADLRSWFLELQQLQKDLSTRLAAAVRAGREARQKKTVVLQGSADPDLQITFSMTPGDLTDTLELFYARGRELVRTFLKGHAGSGPYAVVFAGGGSRIAGVAENIVAPVLKDLFPANADEVLRRITINDHRIDQAIALGAALVASGAVSVEERLLCDIGLEATLDDDIASQLKIDPATPMLVMPILAHGSTLPATFSSEDYHLDVYVEGGDSLDFTIVIDDDPDNPWKQTWTVDIPASSVGWHQCNVIVTADADGMLHVSLRYVDGSESNVEGRLTRARTGRARLLISAQDRSTRKSAGPSRITPQQLVEAVTTLSRGREA